MVKFLGKLMCDSIKFGFLCFMFSSQELTELFFEFGKINSFA